MSEEKQRNFEEEMDNFFVELDGYFREINDSRQLLIDLENKLDHMGSNPLFQKISNPHKFLFLVKELNTTVATITNCKREMYDMIFGLAEISRNTMVESFEKAAQEMVQQEQMMNKTKNSNGSGDKQVKQSKHLSNAVDYINDIFEDTQKVIMKDIEKKEKQTGKKITLTKEEKDEIRKQVDELLNKDNSEGNDEDE